MALLTTQKRVDWAHKTLAEVVPKLAEEMILEAAGEVGLDVCLSYNAAGDGFDFDLTDLQAVSLAAALFAVSEVANA